MVGIPPVVIGSKKLDFSKKTCVMGIINLTPDSFSDGGVFSSLEKAVARAVEMENDGADIIDLGGESTRPGSKRISAEDELRRTLPVIEALAGKIRTPISIDTYKAEVARAALEAGAAMVNDISGMTFDREMVNVVSEFDVPVVIMHTADDPKVMQKTYHYDDVVEDIRKYFVERLEFAAEHGIPRENVILDPGIGFGKSVAQNLQLMRASSRFSELGSAVMVGPSRKSFLGAILDLPVDDRLEGTLGAVAVSVMAGADIIRVHDVKETVRVRRVCDAFLGKTSFD